MRVLLAAVVMLLAGCSYYNGMYKVDHLAGRARSAERDGRTFDAAGLWGQVSVKAESVLVHHPHSGWSDRARLLQGTALARLRDCRRALVPLQVVMVGSDPVLVEEAAFLVGTCQAGLGNFAAAASAFGRLTNGRDSVRRSRALLFHGQALRVGGDYSSALAELEQSQEPRARGEQAAALAGLGRTAEALAVAESLLAERDTLVPWDSLLAALARHDPPAAADLLESIGRSDFMPVGLRARLFLADAQRLARSDPAGAEARIDEVELLGQGSPIAAEARYVRTVGRLARMDSISELSVELEALSDDDRTFGPHAARAAMLGVVGRRILLIADSTPAGSPGGDLRLFLVAELLRDSLLAPHLASRQFGRVADDWPDSPFAPKALLARIAIDTAAADSLRETVATRYAGSPYVVLAHGGDAPAFRQLEDSLHRFVVAFRFDAPQAAPAARPRPKPPARPAPTSQPAAPQTPVDQ